MAIKPGESVANVKCPEWGTGVVLSLGPSSAQVKFPEVGQKRLLVEVLIPSSKPAPLSAKKGAKTGSIDQAKLKNLVEALLSAPFGEGFEKMESRIYEAFLVSGVGRAAIKRQLGKWMETAPYGHQEQTYVEAKALYEFLFPEMVKPNGTN
jgi:hypothetical protein